MTTYLENRDKIGIWSGKEKSDNWAKSRSGQGIQSGWKKSWQIGFHKCSDVKQLYDLGLGMGNRPNYAHQIEWGLLLISKIHNL